MKYFDYAATTPMDSEVLKIYQEVASQYWGNTSSLHNAGTKAEELLENCRNKLASLLNVSARGIYFTSGGTEANQLAITSLAFSQRHKGKHIIASMAEHSSVSSALDYLSDCGFEITKIPYLSNGQLDLAILKQSIQEDTILLTIGHVNGEIGSIQPLEEISRLIKDKNILLHSDCVQSFGKMDLKKICSFVDSISISSHKIYGPKGVGAVYIRPNIHVKGLFPHQSHEHGFRGGTVNTPGIAAFVAAAIQSNQNHWERVNQLRKFFTSKLKNELKGCITIYESETTSQLPHVIGLAINGHEGQWVMLECNRKGFCISTGSACRQGLQAPSKTMVAMGVTEEKQKEFIRISFGKETREEDITALVEALIEISKRTL
ncbi:IscS subfamily cysteine desulfurase [Rossellomorea sp. BNER]|uniref:IscS subfamily cysteine desulfurase n=1 Tax=Rossellomorea sp. BNER TaxID=2962031 RepID=UPI003AF2C96C|nr:IscS subfamily cysteine desulfurase [Rossellomorea sp. BNER]